MYLGHISPLINKKEKDKKKRCQSWTLSGKTFWISAWGIPIVVQLVGCLCAIFFVSSQLVNLSCLVLSDDILHKLASLYATVLEEDLARKKVFRHRLTLAVVLSKAISMSH